MRQLTITQSITNRGTLSLDKYLLDISKVPLVTAEEEIVLARKIKAGDENALATLTKANLRFVVSVAKKYQFRGVALSDLINEGNVGLIRAAKRFDETKGFKFISYAVWWIRQSIMEAITEQGRLVRVPANRLSIAHKMQKTFSQLEQEHERNPSTEEIAAEMEINVAELLLINDSRHLSLDEPFSDDNDGTLGSVLIDENGPSADAKVDHTQSLQLEIKRCLASLNEMEREILCSFFGIGSVQTLSLAEIGVKYDMTGERIRQIKNRAIKQLRNPKKAHLLKSFICS